MPRTRSLAFSELKIGILVVTATAIAAIVIFLLSGQEGCSWQRYNLKTRFPDVSGLKVGAPVRVAGVEVGTVTGIEFVGAQVEVTFQLSRRMRDRVTSESMAALGSLSLLGQSTVDLTAAEGGTPIPEWGYVRSGRLPGQIADVATNATKSLEETTRVLQDIRQGKGTVGRLFTDDTVYNEVQQLLAAATEVATGLSRGRGTAGRLITDAAVYDALQNSLDRLNTILGQIDAGQGSLGRLLRDEAFARSLTSASGNLDELTRKLNRGEGTVGKLMTNAELFDRLNAVADRLDHLTAQLNQGQGTAGRLLQDQQLYENMNKAASELLALVQDIRKNPRKYLNMKVSVF
jgi:phospholipid/cholesterol/gamma-HCH transport system substrate-binding protein